MLETDRLTKTKSSHDALTAPSPFYCKSFTKHQIGILHFLDSAHDWNIKVTSDSIGNTIKHHFPTYDAFYKFRRFNHLLTPQAMQLLQGPNHFTSFLNYIQKIDSPSCQFCNAERCNALHIIVECPFPPFVALRHKFCMCLSLDDNRVIHYNYLKFLHALYGVYTLCIRKS